MVHNQRNQWAALGFVLLFLLARHLLVATQVLVLECLLVCLVYFNFKSAFSQLISWMDVDYISKYSSEDVSIKKKTRFTGYLPGKMSSSKGTSKAVKKFRVGERDGNLAPCEGPGLCRVQRNPQRLQPLHLHRGQPRRQARQLNHGASSQDYLTSTPPRAEEKPTAERPASHAHAHSGVRQSDASEEQTHEGRRAPTHAQKWHDLQFH